MKLLEERILKDGRVLEGNILKVDSFLNHQVDMELTKQMGQAIYEYFKDKGVNKILTLEVSGIPAAGMTALAFTEETGKSVPMVFAKKIKSKTLSDNVYCSEVYSYTKKTSYSIRVDRSFLSEGDRVLIIDDFLAKGQALSGLLDICKQAGAEPVGIGILIEKVFQEGGKKYRDAGYDIYSLAKISKLKEGEIIFED